MTEPTEAEFTGNINSLPQGRLFFLRRRKALQLRCRPMDFLFHGVFSFLSCALIAHEVSFGYLSISPLQALRFDFTCDKML